MQLEGNDHLKFHFSITCHTLDLAVVHCLRAICEWAETHPKRQIAWGGTGKKEWKDSGGKITLRFTSQGNRKNFEEKAAELLATRWTIVSKRDDDPAAPRRHT